MNDRHTYQPGVATERPMTRNERRHEAKFKKRHEKRVAREALHGITRQCAPPSLLQSVRMAMEFQKKQRELEALLAVPAAVLAEQPTNVTATEIAAQ